MIIPFNKPLYLKKYDQYIQKNLIKKRHYSSNGYFNKKCEKLINKF